MWAVNARPPTNAIPGRGPNLNPANRFEPLHVEPDGEWLDAEFAETGSVPHPRTQFFYDATESLLTRHDSPDLGHGWGINCYRGCEHGCAYCFARPYHDYLGWSSGIEFETKILVKKRAPALLRAELSARKWKPEPILMSGVTDCYQPAERYFRLTRQCLEVLAEFRQPVGILTKNFLVTRDLDLLAELAKWQCVAVNFTVVTLDAGLAGKLEPRAALPGHRLRAMRMLADAGVPVGVMVAPVIPGLTDHELPAILAAAAAAGATSAGYIVVRLPHAVKEIFQQWLADHAPGKSARVLDRIRQIRGGSLNVSEWGKRLKGEGLFADQLRVLFTATARRAGLNLERHVLSTAAFRRPGGEQLELL